MITIKDVIRSIRKGDEDEMKHFLSYLQSSAEKVSQS